ncbi:hypothetical protein PINS_up010519 [Pythium insidiosum]|nr:hypothetical protein PINS_up010519 [Pythium insidiosum]
MSDNVMRSGAFAVSLGEIACSRSPAGEDSSDAPLPSLSLWCLVQLEPADGGPAIESFWFAADDENAMTTSVTMPESVASFQGTLDYQQSSRAVPLTRDTMVTLLGARLRLALYSGDTHSSSSDTCCSEQRVDVLPVLLAERLTHRVAFSATISDALQLDVTVSMTMQCDTDLSRLMVGARVLRLRSFEVLQPPKEWIGAACESDDDAIKWCESSPAQYEIEVAMPDFVSTQDTTSPAPSVRVTGGKMRYTPNPSLASNENQEEDATASVTALTGTWRVVFPCLGDASVVPQARSLATPRLPARREARVGTTSTVAPRARGPRHVCAAALTRWTHVTGLHQLGGAKCCATGKADPEGGSRAGARSRHR